jgi:hypothetical protein
LLFTLRNQYNHLEEDKAWLAERKRRSQCHGIQAWTAEMWAILWNIWLSGSETRIHDALDFCWTTQDISNWESKNILHYSGAVKEGDARHFRKADYLRYTPYYSNKLKAISPSSCSYPLGQLIGIFKADLDKHRYDLSNVTVVLALPEYIEEVFENLDIIIRYIDKSFYTNMILRHSAAFSEGQFELLDKLIQKLHPKSCAIQRLAATEIPAIQTPYVISNPIDLIIPYSLVKSAIEQLRNGIVAIGLDAVPVKKTDNIFKELFSKELDDDLLGLNVNKFNDEENIKERPFFFLAKWYNQFNNKELPVNSLSDLHDRLQPIYSLSDPLK